MLKVLGQDLEITVRVDDLPIKGIVSVLVIRPMVPKNWLVIVDQLFIVDDSSILLVTEETNQTNDWMAVFNKMVVEHLVGSITTNLKIP